MPTLDMLLDYIALPSQLVAVLKTEILGNSIYQYGLLACVVVLAWALALAGSFSLKRVISRIGERFNSALGERFVDQLKRPAALAIFSAIVTAGSAVLTEQPTEANPGAHWVYIGVHHFFAVVMRLALFWMLARVIETIWKDILRPIIRKNVDGEEQRYFPVLYRLLMTIVWVMAFVYCIPVFGFDAVELVHIVLTYTALHNTIGQYLAFIGIGMLTLLLARTAMNKLKDVIGQFAKRSKVEDENVWLEGFEKPLLYLIILIGLRVAVSVLTARVEGETAPVYAIMLAAVNVLLTIDVTWIVLILADKIFDNFITPLLSDRNGFDQQLVPLMRKGVKVSVGVVGFIFVVKALGHEPGAILAGLGIGGVAVGFAAKDTLSPFISGVAIYLTRPYRIGDYIVVDNKLEGAVFDIGLRATVLISKTNTRYIIPNDRIINAPIHNMTSADIEHPRAFDGVTLRVDIATMPDKRDEAIRIFEGAVEKVEGALDPAVFFLEYGDDNMALYLTYWVDDCTRFYPVRHQIMLHIDADLRAAGIHMSTPTRSLALTGYLGGEWPTVNLGVPKEAIRVIKSTESDENTD